MDQKKGQMYFFMLPVMQVKEYFLILGDQTLNMSQVEQLVGIFIYFIEKDSVHEKFP